MFKKIVICLWICSIFLKTIFPLLKAKNYTLKLKLEILYLEVFFLIKGCCYYLLNKKATKESFLGYKIDFPFYLDFVILFMEIFGQQDYPFISKKKAPIIVDCGSNFGMSIAYFKYFYPDSKILGIEANIRTFRLLQKNINQNRFLNVKIMNALVSNKDKQQFFYIGDNDYSWSIGDSAIKSFRGLMGKSLESKVKGMRLSALLSKKVDLLKIDIEGSECEVLEEAKHKLKFADKIFIEYHKYEQMPKNSLEKILKNLKNSGFSFKIVKTMGWFDKKDNYLQMIYAAINR